ncbi:MAG: glycosyltransferase family 2 protein [Candidatus Kapaibacteriales bacterium]
MLKILSVFIKTPIKIDESYEPKIAILLSVYNEIGFLEDCIASILNSDYPNEKIRLLIGSDGSDDGSDEILENYANEHSNIEFYRLERGGKNSVLNSLMEKVKEEIVFFIDADTRLEPNTLIESVRPFGDNEIGVVLVRIINEGVTGQIDESYYQKFESILRDLESWIKSTINSTGPFYGIRREMYENLEDNRRCDDFVPVLKSVVSDKRVVYLNDTYAREYRPKSIDDELGRRVRVSAGGLATIFSFPKLLNPFRLEGFFLWSHKLIRYLMPYTYLVSLLISAMAFFFLGDTWGIAFVVFILPLFLFVFGYVYSIMTKRNPNNKLFQYSEFLITMLYGIHLGWIGFFRNRNNAIWTH